MNLRTIGVIINREYSTRVKKKTFLLTTFLVPVLLALCGVAMGVMMVNVKEKTKTVGVVDESGIVMSYLKNSEQISFQDMSSEPLDTVKARLADLGLDGVLSISKIDEQKNLQASFTSVKPVGMGVTATMSRYIDDALEDYRIRSYDIDGLEEIVNSVKADVPIRTFVLDEKGGEKVSESGVNSILSMVLGIFIFLFITMFGSMVMTAVVEEKTSKVVEVLISSVKATELMFGKIIGVALVALTQFFLWIVLSIVLLSAGMGIIAPKMMDTVDAQSIVAGLPEGTNQFDAMTAVLSQSDSELGDVVGTLAGLNIGQLVLYFIVFFVLGYLLYASLFAAIGSAAVDNENDTSQLQMPVTIPLMIAYFIALYAYNAPDSAVALWGSMIPFTSPIVMLARIPFGVPGWQILLSIGLLVVTTIACAYLSAKIYKVGVLMYGKKTTFKDLWKWLKQK
ncbi:MAG: ABC transporter permease [Bacteroidales bacterium]|mgnify:FL=1|nr:ABC transporter permease [Bacteroidales bacterium]MDD7608040.1 ABC transporter permease [Bacteroidales bacterium]MDY5459105.1 ABC transporter permease [Candidatus Cryptobacteroides sp.]MEE0339978.1 ABC transporter permease [Bacteroidales bacterium]